MHTVTLSVTSCVFIRHLILSSGLVQFVYYPGLQIVGVSARFGLGLERLVRLIRELVYPDMIGQTTRTHAQPLKDILLPTESDIKAVSSDIDDNSCR